MEICKTDEHYYDLLYKLLVTQPGINHRTEFTTDVFKQLPKDMQVKLRHIENDDTGRLTCYQLIGGGSIFMD